MEFLIEIALFLSKALIILVSLLVVIGFIFLMTQKSQGAKGQLQVEALNEKYKRLRNVIKANLLGKKELKLDQKKEKKLAKSENKADKTQGRLFVLDFEGDIKASHVANLREEITSILTVASPGDEVLCLIESQGGMVHAYGLAASQLQRIKDHQLKLTASIDKVAASGGYLMASVADEIIAAPFAIVGSIGVVAQVPNIHRLLKKHDVDYQEYTAGNFKRTVSLLGKITPEGEEKFIEQLHDTHHLFQEFVSSHRPQLQMEQVATGEYWYGTRAKELGLIDRIETSDSYLMRSTKTHKVYKISYQNKKSLSDKLSQAMQAAATGMLGRVFQELNQQRWGR